MKKLFYLLFAMLMGIGLSSCATDNNDPPVEPPTETPENPDPTEPENPENPNEGDNPGSGTKTMIVYYSFTNNIHTIVTDLQTQIEADVIRVEPAEEGLDYAANNYAIGSALISAIRNNPNDAASYPPIKTSIDNLDEYNRIIIAAPLWWSNMAAPLQTFLFNHGRLMSGKHIGMVVSSSSSGINGVVDDAKRLVPGGSFMEPNLWIRSSQTSNCHSMITGWLNEIN